ncbi:MAG TPA: M57 family metalloprotease [Chitinophaga sp.]|uniref:M57 family metalloprotease n=1 Tax=Chitinophaga sp. TaxID=1869181 RepID=UPI002D1AF66B|nr:M57 family metalloprotease [Chitinophaga sp.]HVI49415.1 M57 family metalloprotease [Chitinophaga sp.]
MKTFRITRILQIIVCSLFLFSCTKEMKEDKREEISSDIVSKIKSQGFSTKNIMKVKGGYVVEGDIFLPAESIGKISHSPAVLIAKSEQYRTNNLITGLPRVISISVTNLPVSYTAAADEAIARYNALNLRLRFQRVANNGEVDIQYADLGPGVLGRSAGFPNSAGNPPSPILLNSNVIGANPNQGWLATIIAHEIGHTIGFRHTDYFNRSISCGVGGNEGDAGVGAINIPGTPTGSDPNSWMLACSDGGSRPFNANDVISLRTLYGDPTNLNEGQFVRNDDTGEVFIYMDGKLRWINDYGVLVTLFNFNEGMMLHFSTAALASVPRGITITSNVKLLKSGAPEIYLAEADNISGTIVPRVKRWINSPQTFDKYHFRWEAVQIVSDAVLNTYPTGPAIQ